jgi:hypothetical protein
MCTICTPGNISRPHSTKTSTTSSNTSETHREKEVYQRSVPHVYPCVIDASNEKNEKCLMCLQCVLKVSSIYFHEPNDHFEEGLVMTDRYIQKKVNKTHKTPFYRKLFCILIVVVVVLLLLLLLASSYFSLLPFSSILGIVFL